MLLAFLLAFSTSVFAQSVEVGFEGGVPLTHVFETATLNPNGAAGYCGECATQRTLPYVIGPKVEIHLWRPLYFDAEALYSRADFTHTLSYYLNGLNFGQYNVFQTKNQVDRWDVPLLLKFKFDSQHLVRPFVAAGVSLQHSNDMPFDYPSSAVGPTIAAGASFGFRWVRPSIEFRYTRWPDQAIFTNQPAVHSKQDEAQILAGLMFGVGRDQPDSPGVLEGSPRNRRVSLGLKGGLLLTDALSTRANTNPYVGVIGNCLECGTARTLPYVVGPALEVRIIGRLSATAEAFYSHADYNHTSAESVEDAETGVAEEKHTVGRWEAPLLLKYSFQMGHLTPFISAGASLQYDRDSRVRALSVMDVLVGFPPPPLQFILNNTQGPTIGTLVAGPTAGAGASFSLGRVRPSIEVRYTYWTDRAIAVLPPGGFEGNPPPPGTPPTIFSTHNQVQLLLGIMF
jgi:hypothetical protein